MTRLSDLDELARSVRNPASRAYVLEAINAYYGGANRAAIVATWTAVTYDIIAKIRELSSGGDAEARSIVERLDRVIETRNVTQYQQIEGELLKWAHEKFDLLAPEELTHLQRLREDRNLCAHPAFSEGGLLFEPTPEAVRAHLVHAIVHLLRHRPVQGKSAIERALKDITSGTFPGELESACEFLNAKYLDRAKESFIRNLTLVLAKGLLTGGDNFEFLFGLHVTAGCHALHAISRRHPAIYESVMEDRFGEIAASLDDKELSNIFPLLISDARFWHWLDSPTQLRLKELIRRTDFEHLSDGSVFAALGVDELTSVLAQALRQSTSSGVSREAEPRADVINLVVDCYGRAFSFREAERLGQALVLRVARYFSAGNVRAVLAVARDNQQIWDAAGTPSILSNLLDVTRHHLAETEPAWREFLDFAAGEGVGQHVSGLGAALDAISSEVRAPEGHTRSSSGPTIPTAHG